MPNEVTRLAKYVNTMKANPAIAQKESQQPVDGIAALAAQMYNSAPKPKAPVSYPEGTALMRATAQTPAQASGGLAEIFSQAAKNPKLAPYVDHLVELAKRFKAENPDASEEELGRAVFSSAPPEIKQAILNLAYEHVGGEPGYADGGYTGAGKPLDPKTFSDFPDDFDSEFKTLSKEAVKSRQESEAKSEAVKQQQAEQKAVKQAQAKANWEAAKQAKAESRTAPKQPVPAQEAYKENSKIYRAIRKQHPQPEKPSIQERLDKYKQSPAKQANKLNTLIAQGQQGPEAAKARPEPAPAKQPRTPKELLEQTHKSILEGKASRIKDKPPAEGIETTSQGKSFAKANEDLVSRSNVGQDIAGEHYNKLDIAIPKQSTAPKVSGGSKIPLTKADYDKLPLKEKIGAKVGPFAEGVQKYAPWLNRLMAAAQTIPQAKNIVDSYVDNIYGAGDPSIFIKDLVKAGVNIGNLGLSATTGFLGGAASNAATAAINSWLDSLAPEHEDKDEPATPYVPGGTTIKPQGIAAAAPKTDNKPAAGVAAVAPKPQAKSNMLSGIPSQIPAELYGPPAPAPAPTQDAAPQQPQYDESMPDQAVQKIMSLYATPQYSSQIMDMLKQGKRNEMLNTALGMLAGTGAGLSQRNMNEGLSQANLLAGNAFTSGMDRANQAEHEWMKAQIANEMAPIDMRNKAVDAYLGMQGKAADRAAMLQHYNMAGQFGLAERALANQGAYDVAEAKNNSEIMEMKKRNEQRTQLRMRKQQIDSRMKDLISANGGIVDENNPEYISLKSERDKIDSVLGSIEQDMGMAYGSGMGETVPSHPVATLGTNGKIIQ